MAFVPANVIANDQVLTIADAKHYHFGVLSSAMHMAWVRYTCGRLKSDYRYSKDIVYNNFPWPENPSDKQIENVEEAGEKALKVRKAFAGSSLADQYDPLTMPPALAKAHEELDRAVDAAYSKRSFTSDAERVAFLFELYGRYAAPLIAALERKRKSRQAD
jgi:hypothetical protein